MEKLAEYLEQTNNKSTEEILLWALNEFSHERIILATAFGIESQIITDILVKLGKPFRVFTLDTGRLFQETYDVMQQSVDTFKIKYEVYGPDTEELSRMTGEFGPNLFYKSEENRKKCCYVRKVKPLQKVLGTVDAWMTGLRQSQGETRRKVNAVEWDIHNKKYKINPLATWSEERVWEYVKQFDIPYNKLLDYGYRSIGCMPCTRAVGDNESNRAGRWWWEEDGAKECGLHPPPEYQI